MKVSVNYIEELIKDIEDTERLMSNLISTAIINESEAINTFLLETLKQRAFPKIIGKPNRFSLWIRNIKLEVHKTDNHLYNKYIAKQRGKVIGEKLIYKIL